MRRTLAVLVTTAAFLSPAAAASAAVTEADAPTKTNASCNSQHGHVNKADKFADNLNGNSPRRGPDSGTGCAVADDRDSAGPAPIY